MKPTYFYATVTEALIKLKEEGYTLDFNLEENCISCVDGKFTADLFDVIKVYRYEGDSDPADEANVYAIASSNGLKGVLVTGYGISSDGIYAEILKKLHS